MFDFFLLVHVRVSSAFTAMTGDYSEAMEDLRACLDCTDRNVFRTATTVWMSTRRLW